VLDEPTVHDAGFGLPHIGIANVYHAFPVICFEIRATLSSGPFRYAVVWRRAGHLTFRLPKKKKKAK
jgi:hypothetical protein